MPGSGARRPARPYSAPLALRDRHGRRFSPDGRWIVTAGPRSAQLWQPGVPIRRAAVPFAGDRRPVGDADERSLRRDEPDRARGQQGRHRAHLPVLSLRQPRGAAPPGAPAPVSDPSGAAEIRRIGPRRARADPLDTLVAMSAFKTTDVYAPTGDQPQAIEELSREHRGRQPLPDAARRDRHRQDRDDGVDHREGRQARARDRAQQDARRAALQRVPRVLPARTPSSTSSPTTTTTSPRRTSRRPISTSRRTRPRTTTSRACGSPPPPRC